MTAIFADTFYWTALADFSDSFHERALALTEYDCLPHLEFINFSRTVS